MSTFQITAIFYSSKHQHKEKSRANQNNFLCELLIINSVLLELDHVRQ